MTRKTLLASCFLVLAACGGCGPGGAGRRTPLPAWAEPEVAEREARHVFDAYRSAVVAQDVDAMFALLSADTRAWYLGRFGSYETFATELRRTELPNQSRLAAGAQVIRCVPPRLDDPTVDLIILMGNGKQDKIRFVREGDDWRVEQRWNDIRETVR